MALQKPKIMQIEESSAKILNGIRSTASTFYKDSVPVATTENLKVVGAAIDSYELTKNEMMKNLINKIGKVFIHNLFYTNPLKVFKKGSLDFGDTVEEIFIDLAKSYQYEWEGSYTDPTSDSTYESPFKRDMNDISALYHSVNFQKVYKTTVSEIQANLAFTNAEGLFGLVEKVVGSLMTTYEVDEWNTFKELFALAYNSGDIVKIVVENPFTNETNLKKLIEKARATSSKMLSPRKDFNAKGVTQTTPREDQIVLIPADLEASMDVNVLASAFNMDKTTFLGQMVIIDDFPVELDDAFMLVVDRDWFQIYDKLFRTDSVYNPAQMYWNYFLHVWMIFSYSKYQNAIAYCLEPEELDPTDPPEEG